MLAHFARSTYTVPMRFRPRRVLKFDYTIILTWVKRSYHLFLTVLYRSTSSGNWRLVGPECDGRMDRVSPSEVLQHRPIPFLGPIYQAREVAWHSCLVVFFVDVLI